MSEQAMAGIEIDDLTISYRQRGRLLRVVTDVSLRIRPGEAYGLVGESGCGKTTVAMALMRYLPPNAVVESGRISFAGEDLLGMSEPRLRRLRGDRMAMVYQDPGSALNPSMRVGDQIAEVYRFHRDMGRKDALDAARSMLEQVQISNAGGVLRRYPHELSGGQQQRIMFAMALATDPDLLVLDEPTTGLDATVEAEVLDLVEQLRTRFHASILFISHNLGIVARMCERVGVLYAGRLIEEGPAREVFSRPRHPYALGLLRCVPRGDMRKDVHRLEPIPGALPSLGAQPPGCVYADRCPIAVDRCRQETPPALPVSDRHVSRCFFHERVPAIPPGAETEPGLAAGPGPGGVLLRIEDLVSTYGSGASEVTAVDRVSLEVRRGEVLGVVGESGSGKSSLAKSIVGLVEASGGRIEVDGAQAAGSVRRRGRALRRKIQMVFQNPDTALNPTHSARRIIGRALALLGAVRDRDELRLRTVQLAEAVRLQPRHLEARPGALSGGLKQRVAIARALAASPALILCDEPTSALDVSVQAAILNLLADLQAREGLSYVLISHDLGVVRYLADRIAVMYLGQIVEVGSTEAVFGPPHHPYTEALLSAMPALDAGEGSRRIKLHGPIPSPADPPSGCRFHTRCPLFLGDLCRTEEPPWQQGAGHRYRCHIPPDELARRQAPGERVSAEPSPTQRGTE
jgi:peptide/nickel transport system ATP-binding protein